MGGSTSRVGMVPDEIVVKVSSGARLASGDSVTLIKDLTVKGTRSR